MWHEYGGDPELREKTFMYTVVVADFRFLVPEKEDKDQGWND